MIVTLSNYKYPSVGHFMFTNDDRHSFGSLDIHDYVRYINVLIIISLCNIIVKTVIRRRRKDKI